MPLSTRVHLCVKRVPGVLNCHHDRHACSSNSILAAGPQAIPRGRICAQSVPRVQNILSWMLQPSS